MLDNTQRFGLNLERVRLRVTLNMWVDGAAAIAKVEEEEERFSLLQDRWGVQLYIAFWAFESTVSGEIGIFANSRWISPCVMTECWCKMLSGDRGLCTSALHCTANCYYGSEYLDTTSCRLFGHLSSCQNELTDALHISPTAIFFNSMRWMFFLHVLRLR